jgi:decaprenylphospho-beta-D-erythro-pentofuranosid-2-ulose 2-reductase
MPTLLILGATSDIAIAIAQVFAAKKYNLQLAARNIQPLKPLQSDIQIRHGVQCTLHSFDVLAYQTHASFFEQLNPKPHISICVVGCMEEETLAYSHFDVAKKMIDTNLTGPVSILNTIAQHYEADKKGIIVGISSIAGERGRQSKLIYGSSKAGFTAYLDGLRNKLFSVGVHVIAVKPGFVYTAMTQHLPLPPLLTAQPKQVANSIYSAVQAKKNIVYVKWMWRWVMLLIRNIPEFIFKKMKI